MAQDAAHLMQETALPVGYGELDLQGIEHRLAAVGADQDAVVKPNVTSASRQSRPCQLFAGIQMHRCRSEVTAHLELQKAIKSRLAWPALQR